jgi:trehalose synthase
MAMTRADLELVRLSPAPIDRYRDLLDPRAWTAFERVMRDYATKVRGRVVWNVNSTARGGGVAELLAALIPYDLGQGIDERWAVIEGTPQFFEVTKKIHSLLHGHASNGAAVSAQERRVYEETLAPNAAALLEVMKAGDVAVLHDPQTAGLVPALTRAGIKVVWRSHVGVDVPNDVVRNAWSFLTPYLMTGSAFVFSRRAYVFEGLDDTRVAIIAPTIDPFTTKNRDLTAGEVAEILATSGVIRDVPNGARIVLQVSRWDRLKDPVGVMRGFAEHVAPFTDSWLVLAGPQVNSVEDDPEQPEVLAELERVRRGCDEQVRERVVVTQIPMQDIERNAAIVNALQRRAQVVVQKSLAEGFGLTVAEAMWKAKPVVASRVGGIEDQIENGTSGVLIDDPLDLASFGRAVVDVLVDDARAESLGREARVRIIHQFLAPRHLSEQALLISALV